MKRCLRGAEPQALVYYRGRQPGSTWEQMKEDPIDGGMQAYKELKTSLVRGQRGLCVYCEKRLAKGMSDDEINCGRADQRVEHIHPKSDTSTSVNWALYWSNMWVVCQGGSKRPLGGATDLTSYLEPLPENLSCDAYKDFQITKGVLPLASEGYILAPHEIPAFPLIFAFSSEGCPVPNQPNCASVTLTGNVYNDTETLVIKTIEHLNLGCKRLCRNRMAVLAELERVIHQERMRRSAENPSVVLKEIARRFFTPEPDSPWPEYFTLIRWRIGPDAEDYLLSINFNG